MTAMYRAWRKVMEGPPSTRYPVVLITIRTSNRPNASRRRLRRTIALSPPFVDQIRHQPAPASLMAGSQTHSAVAVIVLVEKQTLVPVRIILKLAVETEARPFTVSTAFENRDHAVGRITRDVMGCYGPIIAARSRQREFRADRIAEAQERMNQQVGSREPDRAAPVRIPSLQFDCRFSRFVAHGAVSKLKVALFMILRKAAHAVRREKFRR